MTQVDLIVELLHHPLLCLAVLVIDSILPILLPWFVYRRALSSRFDLGESGKARLHLGD